MGGAGAGGDGDPADAVVPGAGHRAGAGAERQFLVGQVKSALDSRPQHPDHEKTDHPVRDRQQLPQDTVRAGPDDEQREENRVDGEEHGARNPRPVPPLLAGASHPQPQRRLDEHAKDPDDHGHGRGVDVDITECLPDEATVITHNPDKADELADAEDQLGGAPAYMSRTAVSTLCGVGAPVPQALRRLALIRISALRRGSILVIPYSIECRTSLRLAVH